MLRKSTRLAISLGILAGAVVAVSYSWTFTPHGRLDYGAAVIARVSSWQGSESELTPEARDSANGLVARLIVSDPEAEGVSFADRLIPTSGGAEIPVRIYTPDTPGPHPFYLDIHGGGWWIGNGFVFHDAVRAFAARIDAIVVSVDYRLAPEHPYPAALDDCEAALRWIALHGESIGGIPSRIAIGGSSAGGNLAAALALRVRDQGGPRIAFQFLEVPATDLSGTRGWHSYDAFGEGYVLTVSGIEQMIAAYVPDPRDRSLPYVSPLLEGDLSGLPPAFVVTAEFDPLRDQGEAYANRLVSSGVPTVLHREPASLHGFIGSPERAARIRQMAARAVHASLHR